MLKANDYLVTTLKAFAMPSLSGTGLSSMGFVCDLMFAKEETFEEDDSDSKDEKKSKRRVAIEERKRIFTNTFPGDQLHALIIESLKKIKDKEKLDSPTESLEQYNSKYAQDDDYACYLSGAFYTCQKVEKQYWFKNKDGEQVNTWARSMFFHEKDFTGVTGYDPDEIIINRLEREIEREIAKGDDATMGYTKVDTEGTNDGGGAGDAMGDEF